MLADLCLCCSHMPYDRFSYDMAYPCCQSEADKENLFLGYCDQVRLKLRSAQLLKLARLLKL